MRISSELMSRRLALSSLLVPLAGAVVGCGGTPAEAPAGGPANSRGARVTNAMLEEAQQKKAEAAKK